MNKDINLNINVIRKSSLFSVLGRLFERLFKIFIAWLLIKYLSTAEYGIYSLLLGISVYLNIFTSFGILPSFARYTPEFYQNKEIPKLKWLIKTGLIFRVSVAFIFLSIIITFYDYIAPFFNVAEYSVYFIIFASGLLFLFQAQLIQSALQSMFLHSKSVTANSIFLVVRGLLLVTFFSLGYGLLYVLIADLIANLGIMAAVYFYYNNAIQKVNHLKGTPFSKKKLFKRIFRYSGYSLFNEIGVMFIDISTDFFVISHFLGTVQLGFYAFAARVGRMISELFPSRILMNVITPTYFSRYSQTGDKSELNKMFHFLSKLNAFTIFPIFGIFCIYGKEIIQFVFDEKYLAGYTVMLVLFLHFIMKAFPVALALQAVEKPEMILVGKVFSIYNLVMDIVLIQIWGIMGVAIATSSAMIFKKIFEYYMSRRYAQLSIPWLSLIKTSLNCIIIIIIGYLFKDLITDLISLIIVVLCLGFIYLGLSFLNSAFNSEEKAMLNKIIGKQIL